MTWAARRSAVVAVLTFAFALLLPQVAAPWPPGTGLNDATAATATTSERGYDPARQHVGASASAAVSGAGDSTAAGHRARVRTLGSAVDAGTGIAAEGASGFVGRKGVTKTFDDGSSASYGGEMRVPRGTNAPGEVGGRQYSGHAFDQMQGRGIPSSVVDDAITSGQNLGGGIFYSSANNVSVVVNSQGRVITVGYGQFKPR